MKEKWITKIMVTIYNLNPFQVYFVASKVKARKVYNFVQQLLFLKSDIISKVILRVV